MSFEEELEKYVRDYLVFIDTCSLLEPSAQYFWVDIIPFLSQYSKKVIIPFRCYEELDKHQKNTSNSDLSKKAKQVLLNINLLKKNGYVQIVGDTTDNFADNVFLSVFSQKRIKYKLLLITQDNALAQDILSLNNSKSVIGFPIDVKRINRSGKLNNFIWQQSPSGNSSYSVPKNNPTNSNQDNFRICKTITSIPDTPIGARDIPQENDIVYTENGKSIHLGHEVSHGGEGTIYSTDTDFVAKIYFQQKNTKRKQAKIDLLLSKHPQFDGICFPTEKLYNNRREYVGYLMPKAKGKELQKSIFVKPLFQNYFPDWKKRDTVELCLTILKKIKFLHEKNIIMGDINPLNILVVSPKEVYFVDTDSYQIEDFPCPVGTVPYTAPEIQGKDFARFLRTVGNEKFAVATLLFMIMLPGKPPFAQQGGADQAENIRNMDFSYPLGENSNKKTPDGPWRYIWSHLPYKIKEAFYNTFRFDGMYAKEDTRLSVDQWISLFTDYLYLFTSGRFTQQDPMSDDLFPTRFKMDPNNPIVYQSNCIDCGKPLFFTESQIEHFKNKGVNIPTSCRTCHEARMMASAQKRHRPVGNITRQQPVQRPYISNSGSLIKKNYSQTSYTASTSNTSSSGKKNYSQPSYTVSTPNTYSNNNQSKSGKKSCCAYFFMIGVIILVIIFLRVLLWIIF